MKRKLCFIAKKAIEPLTSKDKHLTYFTCCMACSAFTFVEFYKLVFMLKDFICTKFLSSSYLYEIIVEASEVLMSLIGAVLMLCMVIKTFNKGDKE